MEVSIRERRDRRKEREAGAKQERRGRGANGPPLDVEAGFKGRA